MPWYAQRGRKSPLRNDTRGQPGVMPSPTNPGHINRTDIGALAALLGTIVFSSRDLLTDPVRAGLDTVTFFWPVYAFLGDQLKSGTIPGWNPYQFSGIPFLADPESGWWYAPAMLAFGILPFTIAIKIYATAHMILAGLGTYAYGRVIGMVPAGALIAAWAVSQGGPFTNRSRCCYTHIQVAAWIPIVLLAIELGIRATRARPRIAAWSLGGFAISQMLAGWIGQGAMYGLLLAGAYVAFRTIAKPQDPNAPFPKRVGDTIVHGMIPVVLGAGLSAPGTLPRLLYYGQTNLADGYTGSASWAAQLGGWSTGAQVEQLMSPAGWYYVGTAVLFIASFAVIVNWKSGYTRFFVALSLIAFILGLERHTIVHQLFFTLIPEFRELHTHFPERIALVLLFGPAILAGIAFTALEHRIPTYAPLAPFLCAGVVAIGIAAAGLDIGAMSWIAMLLVIALSGVLTLGGYRKSCNTCRVALLALGLLVVADLHVLAGATLERNAYLRIDAASVAIPNETATFIHDSGEFAPSHFFGYDPSLTFLQHGETTYYRHDFENPITSELLVNNRGTLWQVADIQGYNPLQLQRYVDFLTALNGVPQEYHGAYILPTGLSSPLLPLLSPTYIVVPRAVSPERADIQTLLATYPEVASTPTVRILRYTDALPRAWIVHEAIAVHPDDVMSRLATGSTDFRRIAIVETDPPSLDPPSGRVRESAAFTGYEPSRITLDVTSDGRGLLVLGETYADGWTARVDGMEVNVIPVDGVLRGVPVPSGSHSVTLTFESPGLTEGFAIFGVTMVIIVTGFVRALRIDRLASRRLATPAAKLD